MGAIATYLRGIYEEAVRRGYQFDRDKINRAEFSGQITCTRGQLLYEWEHLHEKVKQRDSSQFAKMEEIKEPEPHPLFRIVEGDVEDWEVGKGRSQPFNISS